MLTDDVMYSIYTQEMSANTELSQRDTSAYTAVPKLEMLANMTVQKLETSAHIVAEQRFATSAITNFETFVEAGLQGQCYTVY